MAKRLYDVLKDCKKEEEVKAYYEAHKEDLNSEETVNASHILVDSEEQANEILASIKAGEITFEDAAKQYFRDNPEEAAKLEKAVRENFHKLMGAQSKIAAKAAGRAVDVSADDFDDSDE